MNQDSWKNPYLYGWNMGCIKLDILDRERALEQKSNFFGEALEKKGKALKKRVSSSTYAFNGMEQDNEVKGNGNSYTTMFRQYDPRLGRWFSVDPQVRIFSWQSPYVNSDNNPIQKNDPFGDEAKNAHKKKKEQLESKVESKEIELNELLNNAIERKEEGYKEYKRLVKDKRKELKSLKSELATETINYKKVEKQLNEFAYYDPENYEKLNNLSVDGTEIDVYFRVDNTLSYNADDGGVIGKADWIYSTYTTQDGTIDHFTVRSQFGSNTIDVRLAPLSSVVTTAHEIGHVLHGMTEGKSYIKWIYDNPDNFQEDGHGPGDPNGEAAIEMEKRMYERRRAKSKMPANFQRPK